MEKWNCIYISKDGGSLQIYERIGYIDIKGRIPCSTHTLKKIKMEVLTLKIPPKIRFHLVPVLKN